MDHRVTTILSKPFEYSTTSCAKLFLCSVVVLLFICSLILHQANTARDNYAQSIFGHHVKSLKSLANFTTTLAGYRCQYSSIFAIFS